MAGDTESLVLSISADTAQIRRQLKALVGDASTSAKGIESAFGKIGSNDNMRGLSKSMQAAQADAKNLGFQINDLVTSIASGGGAFRAFAQQGGQISQIFSGMNFKTIAATLTAAITDPFVAVPAAIGLATLAISAFFDDEESGARDAADAVEKHNQMLDQIKSKWADAIPGLDAYIDKLKRANEAVEKSALFQKLLEDALKDVTKTAAVTEEQIIDLQGKLQDAGRSDVAEQLRKSWEAYNKEIAAGRSGAQQVGELQKAIAAAAAAGVSGIDELTKAVNALNIALRDSHANVETLQRLFGGMPAFLGGGGSPGELKFEPGARLRMAATRDEVREALKKIDSDFGKALEQLITEFPGIKINSAFRTWNEQAALWQRHLRDPSFTAAPPGHSLHEKGLAVDVNINDFSKEDIERIRKRAEELGLEFPISLRVKDPGHLQSGRPRAEAEEKASEKAANEAERAAEAARKGQQAYEDYIATRQRSLQTLLQENQIMVDSTKTVDQKTLAIEANRIAQELNDNAKKNGIVVTDELRAKHEALAMSMAQAQLASNNIAESQRALAQAQKDAARETENLRKAQERARQALANTFASMATSAVTGFVQDLRNGVDAAEALYNAVSRIADQLLQMALNAAFQKLFQSLLGVGTMGGGLGGGLFATGGYTGNMPASRPAGIVHGREFVINAAATRKHRATLEAINAGLPGYASGGFVLPNLGATLRSSPTPQQTSPRIDNRVSVVNTFDAGSFLSEALSRPDGVNVVLNMIRSQPGAFRSAMQG